MYIHVLNSFLCRYIVESWASISGFLVLKGPPNFLPNSFIRLSKNRVVD